MATITDQLQKVGDRVLNLVGLKIKPETSLHLLVLRDTNDYNKIFQFSWVDQKQDLAIRQFDMLKEAKEFNYLPFKIQTYEVNTDAIPRNIVGDNLDIYLSKSEDEIIDMVQIDIDSESVLREQLNRLNASIHILNSEESEILAKMHSTGDLPHSTQSDFFVKFDFLKEIQNNKLLHDEWHSQPDSHDEYYNHYSNKGLDNEANIRIKAGYLLEEYGVLPKGSSKQKLVDEGWKLEFLNSIEIEMQLLRVSQSPYFLKYMDSPSEKVQLVAVEKEPFVIQYIDNPTEKVQIIAVEKEPWTIQLINNPSEIVQLAAVKQDPLQIKTIINPSENVQLLAVEKQPWLVMEMRNPTEKVQILAVEKQPWLVVEMRNPTEKALLIAVMKEYSVLREINSPTPQVCKIAIEHLYDNKVSIDVSCLPSVDSFCRDSKILIDNILEYPSQKQSLLSDFENKYLNERTNEVNITPAANNKKIIGNISNEKHPNVTPNKEICSSGCRTLIGDFTAGKDSQMTNFRILDKSTGKTESINTNGIDLSKESPATLKKILSGGKAQTNAGLTQLSKNSIGWGLTVVKQLFSTVNTSAEI